MKLIILALISSSFFFGQEKIVFTKNREIHIMNVDGSNVKQLTDYKVPGHVPVSLRASFTRNGNIAYIYDPIKHGWMSTYIMNQDGSKKLRISDEPYSKNSSTWDSVVSPDGKSYVFVSNRSDNDEIYLMDSTGGNIKNISNTVYNEGSPKWLPDSRHVIYVSQNASSGMDIIISDKYGKKKKVIVHFQGKLRNATVSKDGKKIAYLVQKSNYSDLMIANIDGSNIKKVTEVNKWTRISFSPDNSQLVYVSKQGKITRSTLNGSNKVVLGSGIDPVWSFN